MIQTVDLLADLQRVEREQGRATALTYREHGRYGHTTILRRFSRWDCALAAAGLSSRPCGRPAGMPRTDAERRRDARRSTPCECLNCERVFRSTNPKKHRVCGDCKRTELWQQGEVC